MATTYQLQLGGKAASSKLYDAIESIEVEENADAPDGLLVRLPINRTSGGDLQFVGDGTFDPYTNVTLVVCASGQNSCIFDGYVLSWRLHLDRASTSSTLEVSGQDASWLMNVDDKVREWAGVTDAQVANRIFSSYGFTPASTNTDGDSPAHQPDQHSLFQRTTDLRFLHSLARRNGKICRVACSDQPGNRTGYFLRPTVDQGPVATISLTDANAWNVDTLDVDWDVMRPTAVDTSQVSLTDPSSSGVPADTDSSGLSGLAARGIETYAGRSSTIVLTATADVPELPQRAAATLRDAGWFTRCQGDIDVDRLGSVLRVGMVVALDGAGALHSGKWFVWRVHHRVTKDATRMHVTLVRNAMGQASAGTSAASGLSGTTP